MVYQEAVERLKALRAAKSLLFNARQAGGDFATLERVAVRLNYEQYEAEEVIMQARVWAGRVNCEHCGRTARDTQYSLRNECCNRGAGAAGVL